MKIETYESIIDGFIELSKIFACFLACSIVLIGITWIGFLAVDDFIFKFNFNVYWHVIPTSIFISLPLTIFWYYHRKAHKQYEIQRLRDFWMGWSTLVNLDYNKMRQQENEINKWIKDNIRHMYHQPGPGRYIFASKTDALAFKLAWYE